jgi:uncharacterized protein
MHLTLHLTNRCNLRCRYCYAAPHAGGDMTLVTARAAIGLAIEKIHRDQGEGEQPSLGIIFFGGEPLLQRDLITQIVRYCKQVEAESGQLFHYKITTNGILLDESFLTDPGTSDVLVALSHDGIQTAHDTHRLDAHGKGSFTALAPIIPLLLRHKPYTPVMMTVTPETVADYAKSVQFLYGQGFHYLICSLHYAGDWMEGHLRELRRQYGLLAEWYYQETMKEEKFYFSPFEVKLASHIFPGSCRAERCELGRRQISVAPNGRLYPCVQFVGDGTDATYCIGNVEEGIDDAAREKLYSLNAQEKTECSQCAVRERCNHYCGCLNRQTTGRIDVVSPLLCAHERIVLPIADKLGARLFKKKSPMFIQKHYNDLFPLVSLVEDTAKPSSNFYNN